LTRLAAGAIAVLPAWAVMKLSDAYIPEPLTIVGYVAAGMAWLMLAGCLRKRLAGE
jgi:ABC-type uncharacterized transport system permease subunit